METTANASRRRRLGPLGKFLLLLLLLVGLWLALRQAPVDGSLAWLLDRVESLGAWGPVAFGSAFVLLTMCLLPATPVVLASGAAFGPVLGTVVISIASTASAAVSFLLSRYALRQRVAERIRRYPRVEAVYVALGGPEGWKVVAAIRLSHALPFGVQNLLFGLSPIRLLPFLAATWVSMLPGTLLYVYLGYLGARAVVEGAGAEPASGVGDWAVRVGGLVVAALAVLYVARLGRRILREKAHVDLGAPSSLPDPGA